MTSVWILYAHESYTHPYIWRIYDHRPTKKELKKQEKIIKRDGLNFHVTRYKLYRKEK